MIKVGDILKIEKTVRGIPDYNKSLKTKQVSINGKVVYKNKNVIVLQFKNYKESFNYAQLAEESINISKKIRKGVYDPVDKREIKKMFGVR